MKLVEVYDSHVVAEILPSEGMDDCGIANTGDLKWSWERQLEFPSATLLVLA